MKIGVEGVGARAAAAVLLGCLAAAPGGARAAGAAPVQLGQAGEGQAGAERPFSIGAQSLASALLQFREQSGLQVAYKTGDVRGLETAGVSGTFAPDEALRRLLAGSGLVFRHTAERTVTIARAGAETGALTLSPIDVEGRGLPATAVIGNLPPAYAGGQVARGGRLGLLGNRDFMDTPFSTTSYTARMVEDQQAVTVADVLDYDPAVRSSASRGGILDAFFIRGYPIGEGNLGELAFNGVYGVAPNYRVFADYAERIEVLKGPAALLYGMSPNSGIGGTINIVPKRAPDADLTRITADYASDAQLGGHVDFARRFGESGEIGLRLNGSYQDGDTPLDNQSRDAFVGALALDYRGEDVRASLDVIHQREHFDAPVRPFLVTSGIAVPDAADGRRNVTQPWAWSEMTDTSMLASIEVDIADNLTLFADAGGGRTTVDRLSGQVPFILDTAGDTSSTPVYFKFEVDRLTYDAGLRADFDTAGVAHALTLQASRYEDDLYRASTSSSQAVLSNIYSPIDSAPVSLAEPADLPKVSDSALTGLALADTVSLLDERVQLTLGGRWQKIESNNLDGTTGAVTSSYDDSAITPMAGLVVRPWETVSFYANYIEGLSRGDIAPSTASNAGEALAPYIARQQEVGVKVDFGTIAATLGAFRIEKPFSQITGTVFNADGEQVNRGLELSVFGEVVPGVRVLAGLTWIDAELRNTSNAANDGNRPVGVPEVLANLSAEWDTPFLEGLTLGGSVIYTGSEYVDAANTQSIDSWMRLDLGARYRTTIHGNPVTFRAKVENVLDKAYWNGVAGSYGGLGHGAPRTVLLSVSTDF